MTGDLCKVTSRFSITINLEGDRYTLSKDHDAITNTRYQLSHSDSIMETGEVTIPIELDDMLTLAELLKNTYAMLKRVGY